LDGLHSLRANHDPRLRQCPYDRLGNAKLENNCHSEGIRTYTDTYLSSCVVTSWEYGNATIG